METRAVLKRIKEDRERVSWVLCLLISLFLHALGIGAIAVLPMPQFEAKPPIPKKLRVEVSPSVVKKEPKKADQGTKKSLAEKEKKEEKKQPAFVKTNDEQPQDLTPKDAPYIGARPTKAEGGPKAPDDLKELPAQDGEKPKNDEIVLFDQDRQDGDLANDARGALSHPSVMQVQRVVPNEPTSGQNAPLVPVQPPQQPAPSTPGDPVLREQEGSETALADNSSQIHPSPSQEQQRNESSEDTPNRDPQLADQSKSPSPQDAPSADGAQSQGKQDSGEGKADQSQKLDKVADNTSNGSILNMLNAMQSERLTQLPSPSQQQGIELSSGGATPQVAPQTPVSSGNPLPVQPNSLAPQKAKRPVYDPAFSAESQPGFRTAEKKTRISGHFSFGHRASLNVAATPVGRYQELVYRAIGMCWYHQCDVNRDLIVTGTIRTRILLNPEGRVVSIRQLSRDGASEAQKSFTFVAIQQAPIPPMPPEVRKELIGDRMELFFDFHF